MPRSFFKPWEDQEKKVVVYERKNSRILRPYRQSTKSICVVRELYSYTISVEDQKRNAIEQKLFSLLDNNAATVLQKLQKMDGAVNLSDQDRYYFAVFIVSLRIRTPEMWNYYTKGAEKTLREDLLKNHPTVEEEEIKKELKGHSLLEYMEKYHLMILENYGHDLMAECMINKTFALSVMQMQWFVLKRNVEGTNLLSSDRPLVVLGSMESSNWALALAISPKHIFVASINPEFLHNILALSPRKLIKYMNISTIQQARNKAFAIDSCHSLRFFENNLGKHYNILPWTQGTF